MSSDSPTVGNRPSSTYDRSGWLFALSFALLISHELDAMIREEWRLLPGFGRFSEDDAADVFNLLHVPLFAAIVGLVMSGSATVRRRTMLVLEVLFVGHAVAHTLLRGDARYQFEAPVETITVYGAAALAALHLGILVLARRSGSGALASR